MILNNFQAIETYSAMCHLNNVNGKLAAKIGSISVYERETGTIHIADTDARLAEIYKTQADFAEAYGLTY